MSSPVNFDFIQLNKDLDSPIYIQLIDEIIKAIQFGYLQPEYQFPGTRQLAKELNINRNTIVKSFEELEALGWITILPNKGTFVSSQQHVVSPQSFSNCKHQFPDQSNFKVYSTPLVDQELIPDHCAIYLNEGLPDARLTEFKIPYKTYHSIIKRKLTRQDEKITLQYFTQHFVNYLKINRNLNLTSDQIHFVSSREMALHLISTLVLQQNDQLIVGSKNDYKSNMIFQSNGLQLKLFNTIEQRFDQHQIKENVTNHPVKAIYYSPQHYLSTLQLTNDDDYFLNQLAHEHRQIIIEDQTSNDFYYTNRPSLSFAASSPNGNTIYISDFGNELNKTFQFCYLIGPTNFIQEAKKRSITLEQPLDPYVLQTAVELIKEGEINRILKKHRKIYFERRNYLGNIILQHLKDELQLTVPKTGLGLWLTWKKEINLMQLKKEALNHGIFIPQHLLHQNKNEIGMRIGFGSLNEDESLHLVQFLKAFMQKT